MERNSIYHGDCLDLMHGIPDGSVDMILADLPYQVTACAWDTIIPFEPLWAHYKRIIKPRGAIVLTASQPFTSMLVMSNLEWFKYEWVWDKVSKTDVMNAKNKPLKQHESILVFSSGTTANGSLKQMIYNLQGIGIGVRKNRQNRRAAGYMGTPRPSHKDTHIYHGSNYPSSIVRFSNADRTKTTHPTQKPVALFAYLIRTYTDPGDLVLDNCIGSGTTAIAAIETGRDWIGIEKDEGYFEIAKARIEERLKQPFLPGLVEAQPEKPEQPQLFNVAQHVAPETPTA